MRRTPALLLAAGLAATAMSLLPAAQASAADSGTSLVLSKVYTNSTWPGDVNHLVTLQCEPSGGSHPTADAACASLIAVDGRFAALPPVLAACPAYYDPVTVTVGGTWHFKSVSFTRTYTNDCAAAVLSDYVFRF